MTTQAANKSKFAEVAKELSDSRKLAAEKLMEKLTTECEELDRQLGESDEIYEGQINRIKLAASDMARSRSSEEAKRTLLAETRARKSACLQETQQIKAKTAGIEKRIQLLDENAAAAKRLTALLQKHNRKHGENTVQNEDSANDESDEQMEE